jgi:hypothetical protein
MHRRVRRERGELNVLVASKSPFSKGGFRGISVGYHKIPPGPLLEKGGISRAAGLSYRLYSYLAKNLKARGELTDPSKSLCDLAALRGEPLQETRP